MPFMDLTEKMHIVQGLAPTTQGAADDGDWIEMKNAHAVWTIINITGATTDVTFTPQVASAVAGTGSSAITGGAKFWVNTNCTQLDRMTASTASTAYTLDDNANNAQIVVRYDPSATNSTNDCFRVACSTAGTAAAGTLSMTYLLEPRYGGYQAVIATTSST